MPSNLVGLIIFVALLTPGTVYAFRREANQPVSGGLSAVRETARLVAVGLLCDGIVFIVLVTLHGHGARIPDTESVLRSPDTYFRQNPEVALTWAAVFLFAACGTALVLAAVVESDWLRQLQNANLVRWAFGRRISTDSAWWTAFELHPEKAVWVQCILVDGTYLAGHLYSYSPDSDESPDRELTLSGTIDVRPPGAEQSHQQVGFLVVSARQIQYLTTSYLDPKALVE